MRVELRIFQLAWTVCLLLTGTQSGLADDAPFQGKVVRTYQCDSTDPLRMPTDVAVGADGTVFVADGVNDRIVAFKNDGALIEVVEQIEDKRLSRPIAVTIGPEDSLWIVDTGNHRVLSRNVDGSLGEMLTPQSEVGESSPVDLTDVAIDTSGEFAWVVDNDHHRLLRIDLKSKTQVQIGRYGESIGQFQFPFMTALGADGDAFVLEAINARISVFTPSGTPRGTISTYGIGEGQLYRPTGIAIDRDGLVWVADATLGAIQIFHADGRFVGALQQPDGTVLRFEHCMGIDFDRDGNLYVTDLTADCVKKIEITRGSTAVKRERKRSARRPQLVGRQARGCTICHIEWFEKYSEPDVDKLVVPLESIPEDPIVSRSKTCLSCHDGSVGDSRQRVWQRHGHMTNIVPPLKMKVPDTLPLVDGKIKCRTCHSAHTSGQFNANIESAVFLRVDNSAGALCMSCHGEKARGPELGSHPTGGMPWPVPDDLIAAGAKVGPNPREITCVVCHTPHGSSYDHLLVMPTQSNQLCLSCHSQMRPGMFREGAHSEHPLFPVVNDEQKAAVEQMGTRLGDGDKLICLSCHKLHHGKGSRFMLAAELDDGAMCLSCHSDKNSVVDTRHDLRTNRPEETNRLGMTASTGGPCSSCHLFHRFARAPEPHPLDRVGQCITCHQSGRCAGDKTLGEINHKGAACLDCHDPHTNAFDHFMRGQPAEICSDCHADQAQLVGGGHDASRNRSAWPELAAFTDDRCLSCHRPHSTAKQQGMRVEPCGRTGPMGDDVCIACHTDADWDAASHVAMMHPRSVTVQQSAHGLPTHRDSAGETIGCRTCHDPHAPPSRAGSLLRVDANATATSLCFKCHTDMSGVAYTGHGTAALTHAGLDADSCLPCHSVHANPALVDDRLMAPREWWATAEVGDATTMSGNDARCTSCHRSGGPASPARVASHPVVPMRQVNQPDSAGYLPLFDAKGERSDTGNITCRTCHAPHGQIPEDGQQKLAGLTDAERRAQRLMLRPFNAPNVCSTCHGMDALRRFLYFHDPDKRGGSLASGRIGSGNLAP